ncbi:MAG: heptosyltransferase, partial [Selenomonadaceae bacterium]|nr:heptosyltransferase [Selenomonadaceae bacterium]
CGKHICPKVGSENLACMKKIPVEVVMKYVDELLKNYGQPAENLPRIYGAYKCRVINLMNQK